MSSREVLQLIARGVHVQEDCRAPALVGDDGREPRLERSAQLQLSTRHELAQWLRPDGTGGYPELRRDATAEPLTETLTVVVAALADVIPSKQAADRDRDRRVLPALRLVLERAERGAE